MEGALATSTADEAEIVWLESRRDFVSTRGQAPPLPGRECVVLLRVLAGGRLGAYRTGSGEASDLAVALRQAAAQSRLRERLPGLPHLPADPAPLPETGPLHDPELAELRPGKARALLDRLAQGRETARLEWIEAHVAVANSRGLRRQAAATAAHLAVLCGRRPGGGRAAGSARSLAALDAAAVFERARSRHASGSVEDPPAGPLPLVLSPEAVTELCALLGRVAFSAASYQEDSSFLREHLGIQVFDRALHLRDDATEPRGLAFPFDLEGTAKHPVDLIVGGTPKTPVLDQRQSAVLGLPPTAHAVGGNDARAEHLFLMPGEFAEDELLRAAEGGIWIGWLEPLECYDPTRVRIRATALGARRIEGGALGAALPDLLWDDSLLRALSGLLGVADVSVVRGDDGFFGATSCPALALAEVSGLLPAPTGP